MRRNTANRQCARGGFTLIEVIVSLAVATTVIVAARAMFDVVSGTGLAIGAVSRARDVSRNTERDLRGVVASATLPRMGADAFDGTVQSVSFSSWCVTPLGWREPCRVSITISQRRDGGVLVLQSPFHPSVEVLGGFRAIEFRYVAALGSTDSWTSDWQSSASAPLAIAVLSRSDTILLRIGERG